VYIHLLACCAAIGLVLTSDIAMVRKLLGDNYDTPDDTRHLRYLKGVVSISLAVLWITGLTLVSMDAWSSGLDYFSNPKVQAKIALVVLLTINGCVLHRFVLPAIEKAGALLYLRPSPLMLALFSGSVSEVTWLYAAMMGVGRPLAWKYPLIELLAVYPVLIALGMVFMMVVILGAKMRRSVEMRTMSR
jgi:hypothetical protein